MAHSAQNSFNWREFASILGSDLMSPACSGEGISFCDLSAIARSPFAPSANCTDSGYPVSTINPNCQWMGWQLSKRTIQTVHRRSGLITLENALARAHARVKAQIAWHQSQSVFSVNTQNVSYTRRCASAQFRDSTHPYPNARICINDAFGAS